MIAHFRGRGASISRPDASQRASRRVRMQGAMQCGRLDHTRPDVAFMRPSRVILRGDMEMGWNVDRGLALRSGWSMGYSGWTHLEDTWLRYSSSIRINVWN